MNPTFKIEGFRELERALAEDLPKATARNVLRRVAIDRMKPVEDAAKRNVRVDEGELRNRITTKTVRAKRVSRTSFARSSGVEVATGPTGRQEGGGNAGWEEFGTVNKRGNPYMAPAADSEGRRVVEGVRDDLAREIDKAKARIARKAARAKS